MNLNRRSLNELFTHLTRAVLFWTTAMSLFCIFRYYGLAQEIGVNIATEYSNFYLPEIAIPSFAFGGFLIGIVYALIEFGINKLFGKKLPLLFNIMLEMALVFASIIFISELILRWWVHLKEIPFVIEPFWWFHDTSFRPAILYAICSAFVFSLIVIISDKLGTGVLLNMLIGRYKNPKEERHIFMFLDLKSSTHIAEKLGHFKYSQLIQDCFYDLNEIAPKFHARIYQYVGDEVVLNWPYSKGLRNNNCIRLFFAFQKKIDSKKSFYLKKYGLTPEFKAGMHGGKLMVAEVGIMKKELAFHGDVINTTARIQNKCNTYNASFLVSEKLVDDTRLERIYDYRRLDSMVLKGKEKKVTVYAIEAQKKSSAKHVFKLQAG